MPSHAVPRRVRDFILYYYAKLVIAPSAGQRGNYQFIIDRYKKLRAGEARMSDYDHELDRADAQRGVCAFCGSYGGDTPTHVVPPCRGGPVGIHNLVYACLECSASKGDLDLIQWWCGKLGRDKDLLPRGPVGIYLKLAYERHQVRFSLDSPCRTIREIWDGRQR